VELSGACVSTNEQAVVPSVDSYILASRVIPAVIYHWWLSYQERQLLSYHMICAPLHSPRLTWGAVCSP